MATATVNSRDSRPDLRRALFSSSIGMKFVMAATGFGLIGFVIAHLVGNLQVFLPNAQQALADYGYMLKKNPAVIWGMRSGLIAMIVLHVVTAIKLKARNSAARPVAYQQSKAQEASPFARSMFWGGLAILLFIGYHIAHFTALWTNPEFSKMVFDGKHDVYKMVVAGFSDPVAVGIYTVAQVALAAHLSHAFASIFQTIGLATPRTMPLLKKLGWGLAGVVFAGNMAIVLSVFFGLVK